MASQVVTLPTSTDDFWEDLLASIERRRVIPVIGSELLTVEENGVSVPLYRLVATKLLSRYGISAANLKSGDFHGHHELHDAAMVLVRNGIQISRLYRQIHNILTECLEQHPDPPNSLTMLAAIRHFDLFISATPDDLMLRALNRERWNGTPQTDEIHYAPNLPTGEIRDLPRERLSGYNGVFYIFGKADVSPVFAVHDEDFLEFAYNLQSGDDTPRLISRLRESDLLLIGCDFPQWLTRFFLRLSSFHRLSSNERTKIDFLIGEHAASDLSFVVFLQHLTQDARFLPANGARFVAELYSRWTARHPTLPRIVDQAKSNLFEDSIFISYSVVGDIGKARIFHEELQQIAGRVAWFDKQNLRPGDAWDREIQGAIQRCRLFIPLISREAEQRTDGYFREEWLVAEERSRRIQGRVFIVPVLVDDPPDSPQQYENVPGAFKTVQFGRAPNGHMDNDLKLRLSELIREFRRTRAK